MASARSPLEPFFDPLAESAELIAAGRAADVVARCEALIAAGRAGALTRLALANALMALGRGHEAIEALREAVTLAPGSPEIALAMGKALAAVGALPTAIAEFQRALRLDPSCAPAHLSIAELWLEAGEPARAEAELTAAQEAGADTGAITTLRERIAAQRELTRSPASYVRHLFDQFAPDYDQRMRSQLGYAAPEILRDLCSLLLGPAHRALTVLDLGCGTGLAGIAFSPYAKRLVGVDLSPAMLAAAEKQKVYDRLVQGDVEDLPADLGEPFDLVLAADVLVYLGDLAPLFAQVRRKIAPAGLWAFTTERSGDADFALGPKRRYRHSEFYLRALAAAHNFEVASLVECVTRHEAGMPVPSLAAIFAAKSP